MAQNHTLSIRLYGGNYMSMKPFVTKDHLLMLTYEMDESSQLFAHQIGVVNHIAAYFDKVTVITGKTGKYKVLENVKVYSSNWQNGKRFNSISRFMLIFLKLLFKEIFSVVFSHMTSIQAAFISPITWIFRIKHFLWYTHTSDNFALRICSIFSNGILTATIGSCPITGKKIHVIGHSIDTDIFDKKKGISYPIDKFVHIGRFDPIKNIELILDTICELKDVHKKINFTNFGSSSSEKSTEYQRRVINEYSDRKYFDYITFRDSLNRNDIPKILKSKDAFIHACDAGLDKTLLEATLTGLPVVTINKQYLTIFGYWSKNHNSGVNQLLTEAIALLELSDSSLDSELNRRYELALMHTDMKVWANKVKEIIKP